MMKAKCNLVYETLSRKPVTKDVLEKDKPLPSFSLLSNARPCQVCHGAWQPCGTASCRPLPRGTARERELVLEAAG